MKILNRLFGREESVDTGMEEAVTFVATGNYLYDVGFRPSGKWGLRINYNLRLECEEFGVRYARSSFILAEFKEEVDAYKAIEIYHTENQHKERMLTMMKSKLKEEIIRQLSKDEILNLKNKFRDQSFAVEFKIDIDKAKILQKEQ